MIMDKYEVILPWHGVSVGDMVEFETLHPSLKPNVRVITVNVSKPTVQTTDRKGAIAKKLKELGVAFDGRKSAEELVLLLPDGELEKLFPTE